MKVIFSRKGFDKANGGYPSPIFPDGRMISLPIPSPGDTVRYSDLIIKENYTYYDLMKSELYNFDMTGDEKCHLDPDIYQNVLLCDKDWKPIFGQIGASQTHLDNQKVKENDIFLFFGWFRKIEVYEKDRLRFFGPDLHVIFGYLQIGEKIRLNSNFDVPNWMSKHPHASANRRKDPTNNTVYIAREKLSWDDTLPGSEVFNFNQTLQLTKDGYSRSRWELPEFFKDVEMSYKPKWNPEEKYFKSADIGQEFVIEDNKNVEKWAKNLISKNQ